MQVKRAYVNVLFTAWTGNVKYTEVRLGWAIGKVGFFKDTDGKWTMSHMPSGLGMGKVDSFSKAKALAHTFTVHGVSSGTTMEEIKDSVEWDAMKRVHRSWFGGNE